MFKPTPHQPTSSTPTTSKGHRVLPPAPPRTTAYTHADIAQRAYDIYARGGFQQGQSQKYWKQAEKDLHDFGPMACQEEHHKIETFAPDSTRDSSVD